LCFKNRRIYPKDERGKHIVKMRCNKCGKEMDIWDRQENFSINGICGYGTKYDGSKIQLNLCCDCMEELIDTCVVSPVIMERGSDD